MDIWRVSLDRNVDTGDLVINLAAAREGERQTLPNFSPQHLKQKSEDIVCLLFFKFAVLTLYLKTRTLWLCKKNCKKKSIKFFNWNAKKLLFTQCKILPARPLSLILFVIF